MALAACGSKPRGRRFAIARSFSIRKQAGTPKVMAGAHNAHNCQAVMRDASHCGAVGCSGNRLPEKSLHYARIGPKAQSKIR
jgi:hypothetical protein